MKEQTDLMNEIRLKAEINIVTCGNCGTVLLHRLNADSIECIDCKIKMDMCDCPDLL